MSLEVFMLDGQHRQAAIASLWETCQRLPGLFERATLCTPWEYQGSRLSLPDGVSVRCHQADIGYGDRPRFNRWCVTELPNLVSCDHFMVIHADGFPLNPEKWKPEFLEYDFIGAPWPDNSKPQVGNGGFCIRSRKFAQWAAKQPYDFAANEDVHLCQSLHDQAVAAGFRYAPIELAAQFSLEHEVPEFPRTLKDVFGFHGAWRL